MSSASLYDQLQESAAYVREHVAMRPRTAVILGTGLGDFSQRIDVQARIPYHNIPHCAHSTVEGHAGQLLFGTLAGREIALMAGRLHYYEGWSMAQVVYPVRLLRQLGVSRLVITNVSGGINPHLKAGDIVVVRDHINLLPENPLRGPNDERLGPRFPDMSTPYAPALRQLALEQARALGVRAFEGVYSAMQGPQLETPAEYTMLRTLGSDCTGMSSIPEVLAARHADMEVLMLSMVVNVSFPPSAIQHTTLEDVLQAAAAGSEQLGRLLEAVLARL